MRTFLLTFIIFATFVPVAVFAQQNLVNLPIGDNGDFNDYINAVYLMFISIAALIAVIKIIIAGVKYMFSDIVTQKSDAKRDIQGALLGLLVVLSAVVVLSIINPDLATFDPQIEGIPGREGNGPTGNPASETQTAVDRICELGRGCTIQPCDALDDLTTELVLAGAAVGLIAPGIGNFAGVLVGGTAGYALELAGTEVACQAKCSWLEGEVFELQGGRSCVSPDDALALREGEIREAITASPLGSKLDDTTDLDIYQIAELMRLSDLYFDSEQIDENILFTTASPGGALYDYMNQVEVTNQFTAIRNDITTANPNLTEDEVNTLAVSTTIQERLYYHNSSSNLQEESNLTISECPGTIVSTPDLPVLCLE